MPLKSWLPITLVTIIIGCAGYPTVPSFTESAELDPPIQQNVDIASDMTGVPLASPSQMRSDYIVGQADVLKITIWGHDDLSRVVQVSDQGDFSYPLVGRIHADQLPVSQIEQELTRRLSGKYLINPQVTVAVEEFNSKRVFVLGKVGGPQGHGKGPAAYPLTGQTSLIEVLSSAGGLAPDAGSEIIVIRPASGEKSGGPALPGKAPDSAKVIRVDIKRLLQGDASQNILLENGDTIYVPPAEYFYVFGQVKNPGRFVLEPDTTVLKAITIAGGLTDIAAVKKTRILREENGIRTEKPVEMGASIKAQDIVLVPESFF